MNGDYSCGALNVILIEVRKCDESVCYKWEREKG